VIKAAHFATISLRRVSSMMPLDTKTSIPAWMRGSSLQTSEGHEARRSRGAGGEGEDVEEKQGDEFHGFL
jgi:hypothetical protein